MSRILRAAFSALLLAAPSAAQRQLVEGPIALSRFGSRLEIVSAFLFQDGENTVAMRVPAGKVLTIRQVTATCSLLGGGSLLVMNFWTVRSSAEHTLHHYLPFASSNTDVGGIWVSNERVQIPVRSGGRPVATFRRSLIYGSAADACVGSWTGYLDDAPESGAR